MSLLCLSAARGRTARGATSVAVVLAALLAASAAHAGPFTPAAGQPGSNAVSMSSTAITAWASGYAGYTPGPNVSDTFKTPARALGPATGSSSDIVSLGDGGSITLSFNGLLFDGPGADLAVFENSFSDTFLELAWVEVSSDGSQFFRFPGYSFTPAPVGAFGLIDPTNVEGLAGKHRAGYGTPFDLATLAGTPGLDINAVRWVRIVDIYGDGSVLDNYPAAYGGPHPIYDPVGTVQSGGFDLEAVGAMHVRAVPEPGSAALMLLGLVAGIWLARRRPAAPVLAAAATLGLAGPGVQAASSSFEDLGLAPNSHYAVQSTGSFISGPARYSHEFNDYGGGCCANGWTYSNETDTTTAGFQNPYSAYAGGGALGSATYGVAYLGTAGVSFDAPSTVGGAWFTNTTYAALSMRDGDSFAKKFGGASGSDADYFKLTITGVGPGGLSTGSVDFYLADFRFSEAAQDYIVRDWAFVDLSTLGVVSGLRFALSSSDNGEYGMNTPAYFAMDQLGVSAVPEPAAGLLLLLGLGTVGALRRRFA